MKTISTLMVAVSMMSGCMTLKAEHVLTGQPRPPWSGEVRVLMEGAPIAGEYTEVGIVTASGSAADATLPTVVSALQREAATLGCNGVIRVRYDRGTSTATATGVAVWLQ